MKKFFPVIALIMVMVVSVTAQDDRLQIVASHSILADVIHNVAGDIADVTSTMPVGADPHSFQPVPSDLTALADADVVFVNGMLFEEGLLEAIENAGTDMNIVTASSCVEIIPFGEHNHDHEEGEEHADEDHDHEGDEEHADEDHDHDMSEIAELCEQHIAEMHALHEESHDHADEEHDDEDHDHEGDEEHDHEADEEHSHSEMETLGFLYALDCGGDHDHEGEAEGEHDHGACDPHVWMEPHNVMYWTMLIRDTLIDADPANAETYTANASTYLAQLDALAHDFINPMVETVPAENRILITSHDSLGYFATRYDFEIATTVIPSGSTLAEPSSADVASVIDLINAEGVMAIFGETTVNEALVETISAETGANLYVLYSGSLGDSDSPASTYIDYMRYNVTTIVEALGGGM